MIKKNFVWSKLADLRRAGAALPLCDYHIRFIHSLASAQCSGSNYLMLGSHLIS